jgi:hypothetical protein
MQELLIGVSRFRRFGRQRGPAVFVVGSGRSLLNEGRQLHVLDFGESLLALPAPVNRNMVSGADNVRGERQVQNAFTILGHSEGDALRCQARKVSGTVGHGER